MTKTYNCLLSGGVWRTLDAQSCNEARLIIKAAFPDHTIIAILLKS